MSKIGKEKLSPGLIAAIIVMGLIELALVIGYFIFDKNIALFNPQGWIAAQQHSLLTLALVLLFAAAIPVVLVLYFVAWKYRESNTQAVHKPEQGQNKRFVFVMWAYPIIFFLVFTTLLIPATHKLEPRKTIASDNKNLDVQVIAMRWKWLFIYPEQGIATVNYLKLPINTPVTFYLTADEAPMSSFWIPNLGGQLYAMTSHVNRLNLLPTQIGDYPGRSAEINGAGFADMTFDTSVVEPEFFQQWVGDTKQTHNILDDSTYAELLKPSENVHSLLYAKYDINLYAKVLMKYSHGMHMSAEENHTHHEGH